MKELEKKYKSLKEKIMQEIDIDKITPHSKLYFFLRGAVAVSAVSILFLAIIYVISFVLFALSKSGIFFLSPFGFFGIMTILNDLPWKIVLLSLVSLFALLLLAKNAFSVYRLPLMYLFLFVIGFVGITGLVVAKTQIHPLLLRQMKHGNQAGGLDFVPLYTRPESHRIHVGTLVSSSTGAIFNIMEPSGVMTVVRTDKATKFINSIKIVEGDEVLVFGDMDGSVIVARAVREITKPDKDSFEDKQEEKKVKKEKEK